MSSSRGGHRRRDRSWERDDRDRDRDRDRNRERYEDSRGGGSRRGYREEKRRSSRSLSPRRGDRDRDRERDRDGDRRDRRDRDHDYRRDGDRNDRRDDRRRDRDDRRETTRNEDKLTTNKDEKHPRDVEMKTRTESSSHPEPPKGSSTSSARPSVDPNTPEHIHEDGEAVEDETGMMAAMGLTGFGSTKGKHVEGNQEGGTNVKKIRTWRQYMNRRGGFNRPLDKIK